MWHFLMAVQARVSINYCFSLLVPVRGDRLAICREGCQTAHLAFFRIFRNPLCRALYTIIRAASHPICLSNLAHLARSMLKNYYRREFSYKTIDEPEGAFIMNILWVTPGNPVHTLKSLDNLIISPPRSLCRRKAHGRCRIAETHPPTAKEFG
jgi:hypothetical protein